MYSLTWDREVTLQSVLVFPVSSRKSARLEGINSSSKDSFQKPPPSFHPNCRVMPLQASWEGQENSGCQESSLPWFLLLVVSKRKEPMASKLCTASLSFRTYHILEVNGQRN